MRNILWAVFLAALSQVAMAQQALFVARGLELTAKDSERLQKMQTENPGSQVVSVDTAALDSGAVVVFGATVQVTKKPYSTPHYQTGKDIKGFTWSGPLTRKGVTLNLGASEDGQVIGEITDKDGTRYMVRPVNGKHQLLIKANKPSGINDENPPSLDDRQDKPQSKALGAKAMTLTTPTIRILHAYDIPSMAIAGGLGPLAALMATQVSTTNTVFAISGIDAQAVNAGLVQVDFGFVPMNDMQQLMPASWAVSFAHDNYQADIVIGLNGTSWAGGPAGVSSGAPASSSTAYSTILTNNIGYDNYIYQHELGHLLGARHATWGVNNADVTAGTMHGYVYSAWNGYDGIHSYGCVGDVMTTTITRPDCVTSGAPLDIWPIYSNPYEVWDAPCTPANRAAYPGYCVGTAAGLTASAYAAGTINNNALWASTWRSYSASSAARRLIMGILGFISLDSI